MAVNYIYPFGQDASGGNTMTDTAYNSDAQRLIGNQPGTARQELVNKVLQQCSVIAAGLAQFMVNNQSFDINDSLTPANVATYLGAAFSAYTGISSGTSMLFYEATAPTGWTQDTTVNDKVIRVVNGTGAGTGGSWTISGVTVDGHALTTTEMPSHSHSVSDPGHAHTVPMSLQITQPNANTNANTILSGGTTSTSTATTGITIAANGGGAAHTHGLTADGTWRPAYIDTIVCTKD